MLIKIFNLLRYTHTFIRRSASDFQRFGLVITPSLIKGVIIRVAGEYIQYAHQLHREIMIK